MEKGSEKQIPYSESVEEQEKKIDKIIEEAEKRISEMNQERDKIVEALESAIQKEEMEISDKLFKLLGRYDDCIVKGEYLIEEMMEKKQKIVTDFLEISWKLSDMWSDELDED